MTGKALILIDIQNDFLPPDGSLAVPEGNAIIPQVHELLENAEQYDVIAVSMDYHPKGHISFASTHSKQPFIEVDVPKLNAQGETVRQMLWPDHCLQGTSGCKIEETIQTKLDMLGGDKVKYILKGTHADVDSYSAFADNVYAIFSPLARILHERGIEEVEIAGLAFDYCVKFTAIDARKFNFVTRIHRSATKAVDTKNDGPVLQELHKWGVVVL